MSRLQAILNKMTSWEEDIFQKEYADQNWFKGKQAKHVNQIERERQRSKMSQSSCS
jgi:5'-3' exoribonuclease 1